MVLSSFGVCAIVGLFDIPEMERITSLFERAKSGILFGIPNLRIRV